MEEGMIIEKLLVDTQGWIYSKNGKIEVKTYSPEPFCYHVEYVHYLNSGEIRKYNAKYVIEVDYIPEPK